MPNPLFEKLVNEGIDLCRSGSYEKAIEVFARAAEIEVDNRLLYNRSKAYYKLNRIDSALIDLDRLIEWQPHNPEWYAERAVLLHASQQADKALKDLDMAVELDPENGFRYSSRAFIRNYYGDHSGALEDYEKAIELDNQVLHRLMN
jgi:tetratricopeptide (TPR) repeat protein